MNFENNTNVSAEVLAEIAEAQAKMKAHAELLPFVPQAVQVNGCGNGFSKD